MLESLTAESFKPRIGAAYRLVAPDGQVVDAVLTKVTERGEAPPDLRAPFSIEFRVPLETAVSQGTFRVEPEDGDVIELFLVPIGTDDVGQVYEGVFG